MRCDELGLGATVKLTEPVPEPVAPRGDGDPGRVARRRPGAPVGRRDGCRPAGAAAGTDWLVGEIENAHAAAACVTVNVWPAIVERAGALRLSSYWPPH